MNTVFHAAAERRTAATPSGAVRIGRLRRAVACCGVGFLVVATGCAEPAAPVAAGTRPPVAATPPGHDHEGHAHHGDHVHPRTLAEGIAALEAIWAQVRQALEAGNRDKADEQVHAAGHLLEDLEQFVAKEKAEAQEAGKAATQEVFDCFDTLDAALHGADEDLRKIDLEKLAGRLTAAFSTLKGLVTAGTK